MAKATRASSATPHFLSGGGGMGAMMRAHDWSRTSLGPPERWPHALKTSVSICLNSRFPILIWWGPELAMLYNDAYRPIAGAKHPEALGSPGRAVWREIWDIIGPQLEGAMHGEASWAEDLMLPLDRYGYLEEAYFTYSYSPIADGDEGVVGLFTAVSETTERVLGQRRLALLNRLGERTANAKSVQAACEMFASVLGEGNPDLPFAMIYLSDGACARLMVTSGLDRGDARVPAEVALDATGDPWGVGRAIAAGAPVSITELVGRFGSMPGRPWPESPREAIALPVAKAGQQAEAAGALVVGVNPRRRLDEAYRGFLNLVAGHLAAAVANARAYEEEKRRSEALAELDRAKTQFFSNVSHEFRTPLTLILGPIQDELADRAHKLASEQRDRLEIAHRNALRLLKLVNSLLDFSRIEAGRARANYRPTDLAALTAELASVFRSAIERAGLRFVVDCEALPEPVYVDRDMWEKVVLNLLSNAFKFTFEGEIRIGLRAGHGGAELVVRDTGTGIPASELSHLFERFHRVEGAKGRTIEGSGIGLALVQEVLRLHGGTVRADSTLGKGTTFTATIPFGSAHLPAERVSHDPADTHISVGANAYVQEALQWLPGPPAEGDVPAAEGTVGALQGRPIPRRADGKPARVLVADDNADMRAYLSRLLAARGYGVTAVANGDEALAAAWADPPDLVLADVMMPGRDGFGLLKSLRADPRLREIPIILVSARAGEESISEGLDAGADDYLTKPFSARELLARVDNNIALAKTRHEAGEALRSRSTELETLLETVPVAVWFTRDRGARYVFGNSAGARLLRTDRYRNVSLTAPERERPTHFRVFRDDQPIAPEALALQRAARGEEVPAELYEIRFDDGTSSFVLCCATPLRSPKGEISGAICAATDVTDRRNAELALRESEARFRTMADGAPALIWVTDAENRLIFANEYFRTTFGVPPEDILHSGWRRFIHPDDEKSFVQSFREASAARRPFRTFVRAHDRNGKEIWLRCDGVPRLDPEAGHRFLGYVGCNVDVTETRLASQLLERRVAERTGELAAANRQLLAQIEEREKVEATLRQMQRLEAVGQLTSGVAHDFNNLLTVVLGSIEFLARAPQVRSDTRLVKRLDMMRAAATRGATLTTQLLAFSRRQRLEPRPIDLNATVDQMRELLQATIGASIRIETRLATDIAPALVDPTQLELVIMNLAINARDAMPDGGTLVIETADAIRPAPERPEEPPEGAYAMVSVTDTGTGMEPSVLARAFEPFFTTKEVGKGSGLGLAQVYGFAKQSGGGVRVISRPGAGTSVEVYLPRASGFASSSQAKTRREMTSMPARAAVLLVDDDDSVREVTAATLRELGFTVRDAGSGGAALDILASSEPIDVALLDFAMPGMNGVDVARIFRERRPGLPIVFLTGFADARGLDAVGEERIVRKPFEPAELARKLGAAIEQAKPGITNRTPTTNLRSRTAG